MILAKGNPHFVCDARVLVKPYKEKGKVPDKYRYAPSLSMNRLGNHGGFADANWEFCRKQQSMERGEFSACGSPSSLDSRDPYDLQLGK